MGKISTRFFVLVLFSFLCSVAAHATLIGDEASVSFFGDPSGSAHKEWVVGDGQEGKIQNQEFDFFADGFSVFTKKKNNCVFSCGNDRVTLLIEDLDLGGILTSIDVSTLLDGLTWDFATNPSTGKSYASFEWDAQKLPKDTMYLSGTFKTASVPAPHSLPLFAGAMIAVVTLSLIRGRQGHR